MLAKIGGRLSFYQDSGKNLVERGKNHPESQKVFTTFDHGFYHSVANFFKIQNKNYYFIKFYDLNKTNKMIIFVNTI